MRKSVLRSQVIPKKYSITSQTYGTKILRMQVFYTCLCIGFFYVNSSACYIWKSLLPNNVIPGDIHVPEDSSTRKCVPATSGRTKPHLTIATKYYARMRPPRNAMNSLLSHASDCLQFRLIPPLDSKPLYSQTYPKNTEHALV